MNIIPLAATDEVKPLIQWTPYQSKAFDGIYPKGCNYAVVCGYENLVCLDIETPNHEGVIAYSYVDELLNGLKTRVDRTPHGYHIFVKADKLPKNSVWLKKDSKIEIKSLGALAVVPPSKRFGYEYYTCNGVREPSKVDMFELLRYIESLGYEGKLANGKGRTFHFDRKLTKGERNDQLFRLACAILHVEPNIDHGVLLATITSVYEKFAESGDMDDNELKSIVESALKYVKPEKPKGLNYRRNANYG